MRFSDWNLISLVVINDDHRAYSKLVTKYQSEVRGLLTKLTNGDKALTDDLAQEVFIRAYRYLSTFKATARFSTWLYRIAYNVFIDNRKSVRHNESLENYDFINGVYLYHPLKHQVELLKRGTFRGDLSYLTLGQDAVFNCSVSFFFSVDFEEINMFSNRGYRYAHFNVGMLSETVYLLATALGLGARGIGHFFDDNINSFFLVDEPNENILGGAIVGHY